MVRKVGTAEDVLVVEMVVVVVVPAIIMCL